jgi:SulP family sulfate permease
MKWKKYVPILEWLPKYNQTHFKGDLSAGLTVGVMLIPQGMAYAMLAGLPPIYGLYASIVPLILYAIFGTSRQLAVGPVAMVSLLIAAGISGLNPADIDTYVALAIMLALMVGIVQLLMGVFRLGFLVNFLSHPVISGFTSAAALIIGFSQLKHLLGIDIPRSNYIHEIIGNAAANWSAVSIPTLLIGLVAIGVILLAKKVKFPVPGPLLAVVGGILVVWLMGLSTEGVKIVGEVPDGLPSFGVPVIYWDNLGELLPIALTISFIGFMESIAVAKAIQAKHKNYKVIPNQELIGLGLANIGGAFFKAFPTTGGFSRTAVNDQSGAKTGMASVISALLIGLTLMFLTPLFFYLPKAILASVIMVAVFGLIDIKEAVHLWKADRSDFWMLLITFIGTLTLGIEEGILIGVALSLGLIIYQTTKPHVAVLGKITGTGMYKNLDRFTDLENREDILIVRFDARLYFANVTFFKETMETLIAEKGDQLRLVVLDADSINSIDSSAMHALEEIVDECQSKEVLFYISGVKGPVRDALYRGHIVDKIGEEHFFMRIKHAVDYYDEKHQKTYSQYTLQTNE